MSQIQDDFVEKFKEQQCKGLVDLKYYIGFDNANIEDVIREDAEIDRVIAEGRHVPRQITPPTRGGACNSLIL